MVTQAHVVPGLDFADGSVLTSSSYINLNHYGSTFLKPETNEAAFGWGGRMGAGTLGSWAGWSTLFCRATL